MSEKWIRQSVTVEFLSDAHLGSGSGGDGIDALVARDRHNQPVIWASHLEGVLRDASRRLHGDDEASKFFGRAGGAQQQAVFTSLYTEGAPESRIWRSTARASFDNRAPKDDTLRVIEYVPKGTELVGELELPANQLNTLKRLVQEVDALGGGRSTGAGRVKLTLSEVERTPEKIEAPTDRLVLLLKNLDPLCITATATPDNVIPSLSFVPGRALLGALAAWLIAKGDRDTASLLTSGKVLVSDALPLPEEPSKLDGVEVLPAPLSLQSEKPKGSAGDVPWWAQPRVPTTRLDAWEADATKPKLKRPEDDLFIYREDSSKEWTSFRPARRVRLRNGRPDPKQADASLFAIEQIAERTHFFAELQGTSEDLKQLAEKLRPVLEGSRWLRVGRAGAPVEVAKIAWLGAPTAASDVSSSARLTLTSDLLVRDDFLRWRSELDEKALKELLGCDVDIDNKITDNVQVHGFNGTSRLWRMPATAIRRGSVFEIKGEVVARLKQRLAKGQWLGERTHEGFGRFRLDTSLPGVKSESVTGSSSAVADVAEEAIAAKTQEWFKAHSSLAKSNSERKPSLSQWLDLVADLERGNANTLNSYLTPTTAGARSWNYADAKKILQKLQAVQQQQRALHARLFVRWLRAELRNPTGAQ